MDDRISRALGAAFPDREVAAVDETGPSWNDANETVRVTFVDGDSAFLKVTVAGDGTRVEREAAVLRYVGANCEVPVPAVLTTGSTSGTPYLATAPMPGRQLHHVWSEADTPGREELASQVGAALATLHEIRFDSHGQVVGGDEGGLDVDRAPWTDVLVETAEWTRELASTDRFDHHFDEVITGIRKRRDLLDDAPAALLHGDPAKPNTFLTDGHIGFIDWEQAHVGDPARELVRVRSQQLEPLRDEAPRRLVDALHEGYRNRAGALPDGFAERRPVYEAVRFLGVSGFFDKVVEFHDEDSETFAEWVEAEKERRLAALP